MYSAGWNVPGFLPDSEPAEFNEFADAKQYIIDEILRFADQRGESGDEDSAEELTHLAEDINLCSSDFEELGGGYCWFVQSIIVEIESDDYVISDTQHGYSVNQLANGEIFADFDSALLAVVGHANAAEFWPNVWHVNERGNRDLLAVNFDESTYKIVESYV